MTRRAELESLAVSLGRLVDLLRLDSDCQWRPHFEYCLRFARHHLEAGFTQADLNELSCSVMEVYGGMGSFNDYSPGRFNASTGRYTKIPGTDAFADVASQVFDDAFALRVVQPVA